MKKERIYADRAPSPVGPYNQAIRVGPWVYLAGQIAIDPETHEMDNGPVEDQTRRVMANIGAVLKAVGGTFDDIVQVTIFLLDMSDFAAMNRVYSEFVGKIPPARSTVQVAGLPKGARVEIAAVAYIGSAGESA